MKDFKKFSASLKKDDLIYKELEKIGIRNGNTVSVEGLTDVVIKIVELYHNWLQDKD